MDKITISSSTGIYAKVGDKNIDITIEVDDLTKVSDGYHTIEELYEHRNILFLLYVLSQRGEYDTIYYRKDKNIPGWFILYIEITEGQISYHLPDKFFKHVRLSGIKEAPKDYKWDGHKSNDVLTRLWGEIV